MNEPTPRTDALLQTADDSADFVQLSRQLERELAACKERTARLRSSLDQAEIDGREVRSAVEIDVEAIGWAYQKLRAFGLDGTSNMDTAMMLDRLNLMLLTAKP